MSTGDNSPTEIAEKPTQEQAQSTENVWNKAAQDASAPGSTIENKPGDFAGLSGSSLPSFEISGIQIIPTDVPPEAAGKPWDFNTEAGVKVSIGDDGKPRSYNSNGFSFEKHDDGIWYYHQDSGGVYVKVNEPYLASDGTVHAKEKGGWNDGREHSLDAQGERTGDSAMDHSSDPARVVLDDDPKSVDDVLNSLNKLEAALPDNDGLKWFNKLYTMVTQGVKDSLAEGKFEDPAWIEKLDVNFGKLYLGAIQNYLKGEPVPEAWKALFDSRNESGIEPIQFALAGMVAHIDHDLAYGLNQTNHDLGINPGKDSPQYRDFQAFNQVLQQTIPDSLELLNEGLLGHAASATGTPGEKAALAAIKGMRDIAWVTADAIDAGGVRGKIAEETQDELSGALASSVLVHV